MFYEKVEIFWAVKIQQVCQLVIQKVKCACYNVTERLEV